MNRSAKGRLSGNAPVDLDAKRVIPTQSARTVSSRQPNGFRVDASAQPRIITMPQRVDYGQMPESDPLNGKEATGMASYGI